MKKQPQKSNLDREINDLFRRQTWDEARELLERERARKPDDHWLLTQLGVTDYEQQRYKEALALFLASLEIVPDCPLTLWNLAGTLDALEQSAEAIRIYAWLLESNTSPDEDPCWESQEWADALKSDCVYRLGVCFQHLGKKQTAEYCYRQYIELLLSGIDGSYPIEEVMRQIRPLHKGSRPNAAKSELRKVVKATLEASGIEPRKSRRSTPPEINAGKLLRGCRVATKG